MVFIDKIRQVIESVNMSDELKSEFEEARASAGINADKEPLNAPHHHWRPSADSLFQCPLWVEAIETSFCKVQDSIPSWETSCCSSRISLPHEVFAWLAGESTVQERNKRGNDLRWVRVHPQHHSQYKCPSSHFWCRPTSASVVASVPKSWMHDKLHPITQAICEKLLQTVMFFIRMNPMKSLKNWRVLWEYRVGNTSGEETDMSYFKQGYVFDNSNPP